MHRREEFAITDAQDDVGISLVEHQVAILVRRAAVASRRSGELDRAVYLLLRRLEEGGPAGVKAIADEFHLDVSTISRQVTAMEAKGLIGRTPDPDDHRAFALTLTETGREALEHERAARMVRYRRLLSGWTEEERKLFGTLLARLNHTFLD